MDVFSVARACMRRWYVYLALVLATAALCVWQFERAVPLYERTTAFLVVAPNVADQSGTGGNPLASASNAQQALITRLNAPDVAEKVAATDASSAVIASAAPRGSIIVLTAAGPSEQGTADALETFTQQANDTFIDLQQRVSAPTGTFFELVQLANNGATATYPDRNKSAGLTALAGLAIGALITQFVDALVLRRQRSRPRHASEHTTSGQPDGRQQSRGRAAVADGQTPESAPDPSDTPSRAEDPAVEEGPPEAEPVSSSPSAERA